MWVLEEANAFPLELMEINHTYCCCPGCPETAWRLTATLLRAATKQLRALVRSEWQKSPQPHQYLQCGCSLLTTCKALHQLQQQVT